MFPEFEKACTCKKILKKEFLNNKVLKDMQTVHIHVPSLKDFPHLICHFDLSFFVLHSENVLNK